MKFSSLEPISDMIKQIALGLIALFFLSFKLYAQKFNHDYSKNIVMKLFLSKPDGKGGSEVYCDFEMALNLIKQVDELTLQVPKIIYLVGWQYNGHDDKYPAFFQVNNALKRPQDSTSRASLSWLIKEATKYHTIISLHINMTDAYYDSPLWETYKQNDLISKNKDKSLMVIGNYNNHKAYQINYRREWNSGWTQKRIDSLITLIPELRESGTIHIDAWIARYSEGDYESKIVESEYQKKALQYWRTKGIDVTSEWVMDYMTGLVPYAWHFNARTENDYLNIPANLYTGSGLNPDLKDTDFGLGFLFGESMYGEALWPYFNKTEKKKKQWDKNFAKQFYLNCLQYLFLNKLERKEIIGQGNDRKALFSEGVVTDLKNRTVSKNDIVYRKQNTVLFPVVWKEEPMLAAYSDKGTRSQTFKLDTPWKYFNTLAIYEVGVSGSKQISKLTVENQSIKLTLKAGQSYVIRPN